MSGIVVSREFKQAFAEWSRLLKLVHGETEASIEENKAAIRADLNGEFEGNEYHIADPVEREQWWLNFMLGEIESMRGCHGAPGINERIRASIAAEKKSKEQGQCMSNS